MQKPNDFKSTKELAILWTTINAINTLENTQIPSIFHPHLRLSYDFFLAPLHCTFLQMLASLTLLYFLDNVSRVLAINSHKMYPSNSSPFSFIWACLISNKGSCILTGVKLWFRRLAQCILKPWVELLSNVITLTI